MLKSGYCTQIGCFEKKERIIKVEEASAKNFLSASFSDSARKNIESAFASTNPIEALKKLARCLSGKVILRCVVVEYSPSTGKPVRYDWRPHSNWDGRVWLNSNFNSPSLDKEDPLRDPLLAFIPEGGMAVVEVGGKKFVVQHVPSRSEGGWDGGETPNHFQITKAVN